MRPPTWPGSPRRSATARATSACSRTPWRCVRRRGLARRAAARTGREPPRCSADLLAEHLPQVGYRPPEATYLAWLDCRSLDLGAYAPVAGASEGPGVVGELSGPAQLFLDRARVALSSGHVFGTGGVGRVRLNYATSPAILTEAIERMGVAVR